MGIEREREMDINYVVTIYTHTQVVIVMNLLSYKLHFYKITINFSLHSSIDDIYTCVNDE